MNWNGNQPIGFKIQAAKNTGNMIKLIGTLGQNGRKLFTKNSNNFWMQLL